MWSFTTGGRPALITKHNATMLNAPTNVRFWGESGHGPTAAYQTRFVSTRPSLLCVSHLFRHAARHLSLFLNGRGSQVGPVLRSKPAKRSNPRQTRTCRRRLLTGRWNEMHLPLVPNTWRSSELMLRAFSPVKRLRIGSILGCMSDRHSGRIAFVDPSGGSSDAMTLHRTHGR
jgi:hypothetical protein